MNISSVGFANVAPIVLNSGAFQFCFNLKTVSMVAGTVGLQAFMSCTRLSSLSMSTSGVQSLADSVFSGFSKL